MKARPVRLYYIRTLARIGLLTIAWDPLCSGIRLEFYPVDGHKAGCFSVGKLRFGWNVAVIEPQK
jgi:hypothetical protein